jgi:hypothetical protein
MKAKEILIKFLTSGITITFQAEGGQYSPGDI